VSIAVFGIRHHGPGSARSLTRALERLRPDCVLIEGPSDANELLPFAAHASMRPPVALLGYVEKDPAQSVFYPFAVFSPEWQAIHWALDGGQTVRFIDLPAGETLANAPDGDAPALVTDPLRLLAEAGGYEDPERWWEDMVEHRDSGDAFEAVTEAMAALREELGADVIDPRERRREDHMRAHVRAAREEGFERIAVVCGAWHAPVFGELDGAPPLKDVRTPKTTLTWVPWTYGRLAARSGYGAGVRSPGWYEHLFQADERPLIRWLSRVARTLRDHDADISTAHIIDTARTAAALAALRGRPLPGLPEINDALEATLGEGAATLLALIEEQLIIGERLGRVSPDVPTVPLQRDLEAQQRSLRLKPEAAIRELSLDLRKDIDLRRSHLLHRLALLGIQWGEQDRVSGARGTFREAWRLQWHPEFAVRIVEASGWGPSVALAATGHVQDRARTSDSLAELTELLDLSLLADLPDAVRVVLTHFEANAAISTDIPALMEGLPALARAARYGTVRRTDAQAVADVLGEIVARVSVGLPAATAVDDDAAAALLGHMDAVDRALDALSDAELLGAWRVALERVADRHDAHKLLSGRSVRMLRDAEILDGDDVARRMHHALSPGSPPLAAAAWLEGFLSGSGLALIHDRTLLGLVDGWLTGAAQDAFTTVLPILRRTFSSFSAPERRQIGERVRGGAELAARPADVADIDPERAALVIPVLRQLLGVDE
jgi:hypothetical protein